MKKLLTVCFLATLVACGSPEVSEYTLQDVAVSGEFLFEGPNTLQGSPPASISQIASALSLEEDDISAIYVKSATITFSPDSVRSTLQSALVQWVSEDLELVSVATKSPLPAEGTITLEATQEQDILPYLQAESATVVVDVNVDHDLDALSGLVTFVLNVEY